MVDPTHRVLGNALGFLGPRRQNASYPSFKHDRYIVTSVTVELFEIWKHFAARALHLFMNSFKRQSFSWPLVSSHFVANWYFILSAGHVGQIIFLGSKVLQNFRKNQGGCESSIEKSEKSPKKWPGGRKPARVTYYVDIWLVVSKCFKRVLFFIQFGMIENMTI